MTEVIAGHLYDYPEYYDLVFGSDWKAEFDFIQDVFDRHGQGRIRSLFEPACGTGRLMIKLADAGFRVAGNDLNPAAVAYCNRRLQRRGHPATAIVADMADFTLKKPVDAMFNLINSFRHLQTETAARGHLRCVADNLRPGGLYLLGLHLTPVASEQRCTEEAWNARRGHLTVNSRLWSEGIDSRRRKEGVGMTFDVYTPTKSLRIEEHTEFRTYTARQMNTLLASEPRLEQVAAYDFHYEIDEPITIDRETEDVVYVLRRA